VAKGGHHVISLPPVNQAARKAALRRVERGSAFVKIPTGKLAIANSTVIMKGPQEPNLGANPPITKSPGIGSMDFSSVAPIASLSGGEDYEAILTELVGYAKVSGTTGGSGLPLVTVTNLNNSGTGSLRQALLDNPNGSWIRFDNDLGGEMVVSSTLSVPDNTTIDGRGANISIRSSGNEIIWEATVDNLIIMYVKITGTANNRNSLRFGVPPASGSDVKTATRIWLHHIGFSGTHGAPDGLWLATRGGCDNWTISWCEFDGSDGQNRSILIDVHNSDRSTSYITGIPAHKITWHHNWWHDISDRNPLHRQARSHFYNNLHESWGLNAIAGRASVTTGLPEAQQPGIYYENGIADGAGSTNNEVVRPIDVGGEAPGSNINGVGSHLFTNGANIEERNPGSVFTPSNDYSYTVETANAALETSIRSGAGWQSTPFPTITHESILSEMTGFASLAGCTGGLGKPIYTVTNLNDSGAGSLRQTCADVAATNGGWIRFTPGLDGTIFFQSRIQSLPNNTTIDGRGADITFDTTFGGTSGSFWLTTGSNYIFMYLSITGGTTASQGGDGLHFGSYNGLTTNIAIDKIWLHHLFIERVIGATPENDEMIDFSPQVQDVTISYCRFGRTDKGAILIDRCQPPYSNARLAGIPPLDITMHHNWFENTKDRSPLTRHAHLHYYNNLNEGWNNAAVDARAGRLSDECGIIYEKCVGIDDSGGGQVVCQSRTIGVNEPDDPIGVRSVGPHRLTNTSVTENSSGSVFSVPYSYTADDADAALETNLRNSAGWRNVPFPE
jgi:pectate lyase